MPTIRQPGDSKLVQEIELEIRIALDRSNKHSARWLDGAEAKSRFILSRSLRRKIRQRIAQVRAAMQNEQNLQTPPQHQFLE